VLIFSTTKRIVPAMPSAQTVSRSKQAVRDAYARTKSWKAVSAEFGLPMMTLWLYAKDENYVPLKADRRAKLGLPPLHTVEGCSKCGGAHTTRSCPTARAARKRRNPYRTSGLTIITTAYLVCQGDGCESSQAVTSGDMRDTLRKAERDGWRIENGRVTCARCSGAA
jgi:hypothetical protein